ncbi:MAG: hypothetical protein OXT05_16270, partial [Chloroflexota bacterium]|nr:hypothetical protein [Chloroflexota bacterium]
LSDFWQLTSFKAVFQQTPLKRPCSGKCGISGEPPSRPYKIRHERRSLGGMASRKTAAAVLF